MKKKILILEDEIKRINFLKHQLRSRNLLKDVDIVWTISVEEFEIFIKFNKPDLIILDHDLGNSIFDLNGANAACHLSDINIPVVIWSMNLDGAKNISRILTSKNIANILLPFSRINIPNICKVIKNLINNYTPI